MIPLEHHLIKGLLRAWHGPPPPGRAALRHLAPSKPLFRPDVASGRAVFRHHGKPHFTHSSARHTHSSSQTHLTQPFLALLRAFVDPVLRGALQVLRTSKATPSNGLTASFRQTRNAFVRFGPARRPTTFAGRPFGHTYEPGLQTARHFSQTSAQTAQQAALGLRLALDEARDELLYGGDKKGKGKARSPSVATRSQQRYQSNTRGSTSRRERIWVSEDIMSAVEAAVASVKQTKAAPRRRARRALRAPRNLEELDLYFPEPSQAPALAHSHIAGASRFDEYAQAELIVPLDPDLTNIFDLTQPSASSSSATYETIYNGRLATATRDTSEAYSMHLKTTQRLHQILQDVCACIVPFERDVHPAHAPHAAHGIGYKIIIPGHSAYQVREILIARLGVQQGVWFSKLLRDIPPSETALHKTQQPTSPSSRTSSSHSSPYVLQSPPQRDEWDQGSVSSLGSSWDGMLHNPPSHGHSHPGLEFSSEFMGAVDESHYPAYHRTSQFGLYPEDTDDGYLQDSRHF